MENSVISTSDLIQQKKIVCKITPLWESTEEAEFLTRTNTTFSKIKISDLKDRGIENKLFDAIINQLPTGVFIAGGFMVSLLQQDRKSKDIDLFCDSERSFKEICNLLLDPPAKKEGEDDDLWPFRDYICQTDIQQFNQANSNKDIRFIKFKHKEDKRPEIQVMKMAWYESAEHVIDTFDLTISQIATDGEFIYMNPLTPMDLASKKLVLHRMQFPASTIRRIIKYANKGYYACPGSLVNISKNIQEWTKKVDIDEENFVYLD